MPEQYVQEPAAPADPRLGRFVEFDIRSADYPIRALLGPTTALRTRQWSCTPYLDQGNVGACVGFSMAHDVAAEPMPLAASNAMAMDIYRAAQRIDPWPGEAYEGTSVLAGIKTLQAMKFVSEYRWAFGIQDVLETLSNLGPIIFGLNWYQDMFNPDAQGIIRPTGALAGGHAILAVGYDHERQLVRFHNSWGTWWGQGGDCFITVPDLTRLLAERGEACVPVVRTNPAPAPTPPPEPAPPTPEPPAPASAAYSLPGSVVYHLPHHRYSNATMAKATWYASVEAAVAAGKRLCKICAAS